jgi:hypothetical protein
VQSRPMRACKLGLTTSHKVPSPIYVPSLTLMPTWQHFLEWSLGLVLRVGLNKMLNPTHNTKPENLIAKYSQDLTIFNENQENFSDSMRLKVWNFSSMLGLETPLWTSPYLPKKSIYLIYLYKTTRWHNTPHLFVKLSFNIHICTPM